MFTALYFASRFRDQEAQLNRLADKEAPWPTIAQSCGNPEFTFKFGAKTTTPHEEEERLVHAYWLARGANPPPYPTLLQPEVLLAARTTAHAVDAGFLVGLAYDWDRTSIPRRPEEDQLLEQLWYEVVTPFLIRSGLKTPGHENVPGRGHRFLAQECGALAGILEKEQTRVGDEDAAYTASDLAKIYGLLPDATRKALERWRNQDSSEGGYIATGTDKVNEIKYLYIHSAVRPVLEHLKSLKIKREIRNRRTKSSAKPPENK